MWFLWKFEITFLEYVVSWLNSRKDSIWTIWENKIFTKKKDDNHIVWIAFEWKLIICNELNLFTFRVYETKFL